MSADTYDIYCRVHHYCHINILKFGFFLTASYKSAFRNSGHAGPSSAMKQWPHWAQQRHETVATLAPTAPWNSGHTGPNSANETAGHTGPSSAMKQWPHWAQQCHEAVATLGPTVSWSSGHTGPRKHFVGKKRCNSWCYFHDQLSEVPISKHIPLVFLALLCISKPSQHNLMTTCLSWCFMHQLALFAWVSFNMKLWLNMYSDDCSHHCTHVCITVTHVHTCVFSKLSDFVCLSSPSAHMGETALSEEIVYVQEISVF